MFERLEIEPSFSVSTAVDLDALEASNKILEKHNIHSFLPKFRALLASRLSNPGSDNQESEGSSDEVDEVDEVEQEEEEGEEEYIVEVACDSGRKSES